MVIPVKGPIYLPIYLCLLIVVYVEDWFNTYLGYLPMCISAVSTFGLSHRWDSEHEPDTTGYLRLWEGNRVPQVNYWPLQARQPSTNLDVDPPRSVCLSVCLEPRALYLTGRRNQRVRIFALQTGTCKHDEDRSVRRAPGDRQRSQDSSDRS